MSCAIPHSSSATSPSRALRWPRRPPRRTYSHEVFLRRDVPLCYQRIPAVRILRAECLSDRREIIEKGPGFCKRNRPRPRRSDRALSSNTARTTRCVPRLVVQAVPDIATSPQSGTGSFTVTDLANFNSAGSRRASALVRRRHRPGKALVATISGREARINVNPGNFRVTQPRPTKEFH